MEPWRNDASGMQIGEFSESPYVRQELKDFLNADIGDAIKVLVAPKGYGKTLFLKYKAFNIRQRYKNSISIFPDSSSDIEFLQLSLEEKEIYQYARELSTNNWSLLWQFCLIAKAVQLTAPDEIEDDYLKTLLKDSSISIGEILTSVIRDADNRDTSLTKRLITLKNIYKKSDRDVAIFIDNADEMFGGYYIQNDTNEISKKTLINNNFNAFSSSQTVTNGQLIADEPTMWAASQIGLLLAIREIERSSRKLNIFTSLRSEAVYASKHPMALQARTHTLPINYSKEDLHNIFNWHVNLTKPEKLVSPKADIASEKLIGTQTVKHTYVMLNDKLISEDLVDLIIRHTCFSPREVVTIGGAIALLSIAERTSENRDKYIRDIINRETPILFTTFRENLIPRWPNEVNEVLKNINFPVIFKDNISKVQETTLNKLFSLGLIGTALENHSNGICTQQFLSKWDNRYSSELTKLPNSKYYYLHPWMFDYQKALISNFRKDQKNIFGHDCIYYPPPPLELELKLNGNNKIALWVNGILDGTHNTGEYTKPAATMLILLLCIYDKKSTQVSAKDFEIAKEKFSAINKIKNIQYSDIFKNSESRSHIKSCVSSFPKLAEAVFVWHELFNWVGDDHVNVNFVNLDGLYVDLDGMDSVYSLFSL